jgi:uncharacterized protein YbjT (DUF2867 family)
VPLKVLITGSSGMLGRAVLLESLERAEVSSVLIINRSPLDIKHPKLTELILPDFLNISDLKNNLKGFDACYFCSGCSSMGISEEEYKKNTLHLTLCFAKEILKQNPQILFFYLSAAGVDLVQKKGIMWAKIRKNTEDALKSLGFKKTYIFRPGYIQPIKGVKSKVKLYNLIYFICSPFFPFLNRFFPELITTSERLAQAMLKLTLDKSTETYFDNELINTIAAKKYPLKSLR